MSDPNSNIVKLEGYQLGEALGKGTQGSVYRAAVKEQGGKRKRDVAIKVVLKNKLSRVARDNIVTEIGLLKKLSHRFIVELVDFHWDDRYIYIVMEYCGGGDLSSVIRQRRCLSEPQVQRLLQQLGSALQYLREHDVSHLDLKPSNILLSDSRPPLLKLADFGLAQHLEVGGTERGLKGSPLYMAPEILTQDLYTPKADIWSTGVILYESLFGRAPFSSETLEQLVVKIKEDKPVVIPTSRKISADCRDLLTRCLVRCRDKRIDFPDFFQHPFLDLAHLPSSSSLQEATLLVSQAVTADREGKVPLAIQLYEEALQYFLPLVQEEQWAGLRGKVRGYVRRVRELKGVAGGPAEQLLSMYKGSSVQDGAGVELCLAAEEYEAEGRLKLALDNMTQGLGVLVPALAKEPKGARRDLLVKCVQGWMERGERIKEKIGSEEGTLGAEGETQSSSCSLQ